MHTEIYKIKGRKYRYEVANYRVGDKVKHKKKYLGPLQPVNKSQKKKINRKSSVFVRSLTEDEKHHLLQAQNSPKALVRDRAKIIIFSSEGKAPKEIAAQLKRDYSRVLAGIKKFNDDGVGSLKFKTSSGRPKRITKEQEKDLVEMALKSPNEANLPYNNWNCRLLALWFRQRYSQEISDEWVRELLIRNRITFTVPKHKLMKADETLREAFKKS